MRVTAAFLAILAGGGLLVLPALSWFRAGDVWATGVAADRGLWIVPVLGLVCAELGLRCVRGLLAGRAVRAVAIWLAVVGAVALAWTTWVASRGAVHIAARLDDADVTLRVPVQRLPAAVGAPVLAGAVVVLGLVLARPGRRG